MDLKVTQYEIVGRTAVVTLNRPHRGNAWTGRMHAEYLHNVGLADADPEVRVIVVTGAVLYPAIRAALISPAQAMMHR